VPDDPEDRPDLFFFAVLETIKPISADCGVGISRCDLQRDDDGGLPNTPMVRVA
jgi:hypothetical protein